MCYHSGGIVNRALKFGTPVQTLTLFESLLDHDQYISQIQQHFVESIINKLTSESTPTFILLSYKSITKKCLFKRGVGGSQLYHKGTSVLDKESLGWM